MCYYKYDVKKYSLNMLVYSLSVLNCLHHSLKLWVKLVDAVQQGEAGSHDRAAGKGSFICRS